MSGALVTKTKQQTPAPILKEPPVDLTKQQKAAVLLNVLISAGTTPNLDDIETDDLKIIVDIMASFGEVDRQTVDLVILEFLSELQDFGVSLRGELEDTLTSLKGHVSDAVLEKIRKAYIRSPKMDVWTRIASADPKQLQTCLDGEHIQIAATVLSKIPSTLGAKVLGGMEPVRARETMLAIINSQEIIPEVIEIIGQSISDNLFRNDGPSAFAKPPVERAGDIMNFAQSDIRERIMDDFGKNEPTTAERIRKVMFTFADIPARIHPRDVSAITRTVEPDILLRALKDSPIEAEFILSNLSSRVADQMREELSELEAVKKTDAEAAMTELIVGIRQLETDGAITFVTDEDEEE